MKAALPWIVAAVALPGAGWAAPDFSASEITASPGTPREADVVRFTVHLRNRGDAPAEFTQVAVEWPLMGFLLGVEGLEGAARDEASRTVSAAVHLPPGSERAIHLDVLAPRDSGGDALGVSARMAHYPSGTQQWIHHTVTIDTRLPGSGEGKGGVRATSAGIWVLAWLVLAAGIWAGVGVLKRGRRRNGQGGLARLIGVNGTALALAIPLGFWMIFAGMAWRDHEALHRWPEATATIVGRRDRSQTVTSSRRSSSGGGTVTTQSEIVTPEFALRYVANGRVMHSTGYDTGSSLRVGGRVRREEELRDWVPGREIPCWYDPDDPYDVVVRRGFGGAYWFALIPLPVFWIGLRSLRREGPPSAS